MRESEEQYDEMKGVEKNEERMEKVLGQFICL